MKYILFVLAVLMMVGCDKEPGSPADWAPGGDFNK